jgi:hypothetical protein
MTTQRMVAIAWEGRFESRTKDPFENPIPVRSPRSDSTDVSAW